MDPSRAIQHEISSLKGAVWGLAWVQIPRGQRLGLSALEAALGVGSWSRGRPQAYSRRGFTWSGDCPGLVVGGGNCRPAALQPLQGSLHECRGAGRAVTAAGRGGGGNRLWLQLCFFSSPTELTPRPACSPAAQRPRGWAGPCGSLWGGASRAGPGQVHTAALCSGVGRPGASPGPRLVALETSRAPTGCPGVQGEGAALLARPGSPGAESATAAEDPVGWGPAEWGVLPILGPGWGVPHPVSERARVGVP